ncbi:hypothetical protein N7495_000702 [Penicillium taxi]|uniref:uncharacterized protein n=1 Tax=Penicillium taxi TaxID=168475 RepID=UPI0025455C85|nr:uncharacterized protein N7495_000702 [Penicillium taxi]KAJ5908020.1 hypothetical protein N7495_000702 [Penicillium taxi]
MFLINQVVMALNDLAKNGTMIAVRSEATESNCKGRFDVAFNLYDQNFTKLADLLIFEMKRPNVIKRSQFQCAQIQQNPSKEKMRQMKSGIFENDRKGTWLVDNAIMLSKQAAKYFRFCRRVILFDWYSMVGLTFAPFRRRDLLVHGIILQEGAGRTLNFHQLLFAMVMEELEEWEQGYPGVWP